MKKVYGIGTYDGDQPTLGCSVYARWKGMLRKVKYRGYTICQDWLLFSTFRKWMYSQDWKGCELVPSGQNYCPEECAFIPPSLSRMIVPCIGAYRYKGGFRVAFGNQCDRKHVGVFQCRDEAIARYIEVKREAIEKLCNGHVRHVLLQKLSRVVGKSENISVNIS